MIEAMLYFIVHHFFGGSSIATVRLAVVFGAVWLASYWPPLLRKPWLWAVLAGSAVLTPIAIAFTDLALPTWIWQAYTHFWSPETLTQWVLLINVPVLLLNGLVKEGAKLVPVVVYWWRGGRDMPPQFGLIMGAAAGAAFGILWGVWWHNNLVNSGWTWEAAVQAGGIEGAFLPFVEPFVVVGFHTACCALAGYGLARGWGWQFYLLASSLDGVLSYCYLFHNLGLFHELTLALRFPENSIVLLLIGAWTCLVAGAALWLRWRKPASVTGT